MEKRKIVICASASFESEIIKLKNKLKKRGFEVIKYPTKIKKDFLNSYKKEFSEHYEAIFKADAILALNLEKKGLFGYIGSGVFAEIAFAIGLNKVLNKKIEVYYLNPIPEGIFPHSDELKFWQELGWIKLFKMPKI
ncbi:MAG: hypothetical protein U9O55_04275 [Patescibacteria group bacterium]|nr:hypothetical protein [Patescibacteria group bacterium]